MTLETTEITTVATTHQQQAPALSSATMEQVVVHNDLSKLTPAQRLEYYMRTCEALGLNPLTRPLAYLNLKDGEGGYKLTLYATRDATEQLRRRDSINIQIVNREIIGDTYIVTARATTPGGRFDESTGVVSLVGKYGKLTGDMLSNAMMKAETKAKRRVTLSISGLGFIDESEVDSIPGARRVQVDEVGEVIDMPVAPTPQGVAAPKAATQQAAPAPKVAAPAQQPRPVAQPAQATAQRPAQAPQPPQPAPAPQRQPQTQPAAPQQAQPASQSGNGRGNGQAGDPRAISIRFGKYAGMTLGQIAATDMGYAKWLADNAQQSDVREAAKAIIAATPQPQPTQQGPTQQQISRLMAIAHEGNIAKETIQAYMQQHYGIDSLKQLTRAQYDEVCTWLQTGGVDEDAPPDMDDVPPEAYDGEQQETFGDQTAPLW